MDMINIGYSGASTAQVELNVTAQNTANAMTDGYTRQVAVTSTIGASSGSANSAGNGVQVDSIRRVSNQYQVNPGLVCRQRLRLLQHPADVFNSVGNRAQR